MNTVTFTLSNSIFSKTTVSVTRRVVSLEIHRRDLSLDTHLLFSSVPGLSLMYTLSSYIYLWKIRPLVRSKVTLRLLLRVPGTGPAPSALAPNQRSHPPIFSATLRTSSAAVRRTPNLFSAFRAEEGLVLTRSAAASMLLPGIRWIIVN